MVVIWCLVIFTLIGIFGCEALPAGEAAAAKVGGICFRMDDNHSPKNWRDIAEVFNRHKANFCASLNVGRIINDKGFHELIKFLQDSGHEVMDHSPLHTTAKFTFAPGKKAADYSGKPGVEHISGSTVCLEYVLPDKQLLKKIKPISVTISGDILTFVSDLDNKTLKNMGTKEFPVYLPDQEIVLQAKLNKDQRSMRLSTVWAESNVQLEYKGMIYPLNKTIFSMSPQAHILLGQNSLDIFAAIGAKRPYTWIQPGGAISNLTRQQAKLALGDELGYISGACYGSTSRKVFNEYNPDGSLAFGMQWGNFNEEGKGLESLKTRIAHQVALHHVLIGHSHLSPKGGDWKAYMQKLDQLLIWCNKTGILVRTQSEWAKILYSDKQNPATEIFPLLTNDRDENKIPDGYVLKNAVTAVGDNTGEVILSVDKPGLAFSINDLAGLEKGINVLSVKVKGLVGQKVCVHITFDGVKGAAKNLSWALKGGTWENLTGEIEIPESASMADISWNLEGEGNCRIGQPSLKP